MARKRIASTEVGPDWFLPEWMAALKVKQAHLAKSTGWSVATTNDIYHGKTDYYRAIANEAATALNIEVYELFMHPDDAMAIRRLRQSAIQIAAESSQPFTSQPPLKAVGKAD